MEAIIDNSDDEIIFKILQNKKDYPSGFFKNSMMRCFKKNKLKFLKDLDIESNCNDFIEEAIISNKDEILKQLVGKIEFTKLVIKQDRIDIIKKYNIDLNNYMYAEQVVFSNSIKCLDYMIEQQILISALLYQAGYHNKPGMIKKILENGILFKEEHLDCNKLFLNYPELYEGKEPFLNYACRYEDMELVKKLLDEKYKFSYDAYETKSEEIRKLLSENEHLLTGTKSLWVLSIAYTEHGTYEDNIRVLCDTYNTLRECEERLEYYKKTEGVDDYNIKKVLDYYPYAEI